VDVSIVIATFGGREWPELARKRAVPSAEAQGVPVIVEHGETLHEARNAGLARVQTEWVVHLDADDMLEPGYVEQMATGTADLRGPSLLQYRGMRPRSAAYLPRVWGHDHQCTAPCLEFGNFLVIGTAVRADMLREVGGWRDYAWSEDYDAWLRCWLAGATVEMIPGAIYRAYWNPGSRNHAPSNAFKLAVHRQIYQDNFGRPMP